MTVKPGGSLGYNALATATVTVDEPLCRSLVAVIVAEPNETPVTRPLLSTVATAGALLAQVMTRPLSRLPFASFGVAVSRTVCPTPTVAVGGLTVTDATGTATVVSEADPVFPSLVAVIVAEPSETPATKPLVSTVATDGALLVQVTTRPLSGLPLASLVVAVSRAVCPTPTVAVGGLTVTDATGTAPGGGFVTLASGCSHAAMSSEKMNAALVNFNPLW